jgi:hypothetical protein
MWHQHREGHVEEEQVGLKMMMSYFSRLEYKKHQE